MWCRWEILKIWSFPYLFIIAADGQELAAWAPGHRFDTQRPLIGTVHRQQPAIQRIQQHFILWREDTHIWNNSTFILFMSGSPNCCPLTIRLLPNNKWFFQNTISACQKSISAFSDYSFISSNQKHFRGVTWDTDNNLCRLVYTNQHGRIYMS